MSDIYLQITETPTVVTLSAPVISGAISSTVTVANTVTVALDANSLSALENVTVTVGAAITGTVTVSNFPASQAVTFSAVSISNFPASQAVTFSGISVSNFPASQAVTFGQAIVSASNITGLNNSVGTDGGTPTSTNFIKIGGHQDGANQVEHIVHVSAGGAMKVDASDSTVTFGAIRGTVTVGNSVTISSLPAISGTVTANVAGNLNNTIEFYDESNPQYVVGVHIKDLAGNVIGTSVAPMPISGTVTVGNSISIQSGNITIEEAFGQNSFMPISGTVTIGAGTNQIGSVTASISGTVPISISSVTVGNSVTIGSLPAISGTVTASISSFATSVTARLINPAGTAVTYAEVGTAGSPSIDVLSIQGVTSGSPVPISISSVTIGNTVTIAGTVTANTFALQGTAVTTSNFTSTTASTVLASFNATREVLTIFNEGAGNLHICAGATCTTIAYQVRLSAGDYYEVPNHQTTITHSAVYATAGTARVTEVS
jgi:hypothetical protein